MKLMTVESSSIYAVGYDATTRTMDVVFYRTGIHRFTDVPPKVCRELRNSDSPGSYYAMFLEGRYHEHPLR